MEKQSASSSKKFFHNDHWPKTMNLLRRDEKYCDAVIEAGGERFKIHRNVFGMHSDFFDKAFTVEMREKYDDVVKVNGVSAQVMKSIVDFLYCGEIAIEPDNVMEVFMAADYLMIDSMKSYSVQCMSEYLDEQNCIDVWRLAKNFSLDELLVQCLNFIAGNLKSVADQEEFSSLSYEEVKESVRFCCEKEASQDIVCAAILTWVKHGMEDREENFEALFTILNCIKLSKDFLNRLARNEPLVKRSPTALGAVVAELINRVDKLSEENDEINKRNRKLNQENRAISKKFEELNKTAKETGKKYDKLSTVSKAATEEIEKLLKHEQGLSKEKRDLILAQLSRINPSVKDPSIDFAVAAENVVLAAKAIYSFFTTKTSE